MVFLGPSGVWHFDEPTEVGSVAAATATGDDAEFSKRVAGSNQEAEPERVNCQGADTGRGGGWYSFV